MEADAAGAYVTLKNGSSAVAHSSRWPPPALLCAWPVAIMAIMVMLGWLTHVPWMVQVLPGATALVFSNAVCLFLLASSLMLTTRQHKWTQPFNRAVGIVVFLIGTTVLLQYYFEFPLSFDLSGLHRWLNDNPGRMAPNTAVAHVFGGSAIFITTLTRSGLNALLAVTCAFAMLLLGLTGLVGYQLHPELLYGWHVSTRMALHSGVAFVLLGMGFLSAIYRDQKLGELFRMREDLRIGLFGGAVIMVVGILCGISAFVLIQDQILTVTKSDLHNTFQSRHDLIISEISTAVQANRNFANNPGVKRELARLKANPQDAKALKFLQDSLMAFTDTEASGARLYGTRRQLVAKAGHTHEAPHQLSLRQPQGTTLFWSNKLAGVHVVHDIRIRNTFIGRIESEFVLPGIWHMREVMQAFGTTSELMLCVQAKEAIRCLPTQLQPWRTEIPASTPAGETLMVQPLAGNSGVGFGTDYRGVHVLAAYGPISDFGLGMVLKINVDEIYGPLRQKFEYMLLLILLIVGVSILLLRSRMVPLVRRLAQSEQRFRTLFELAPDAMLVTDRDGKIVWSNSQCEHLFGYTHDELVGQGVEILVPEKLRGGHAHKRKVYESQPVSREMGAGIELHGQRKDGTIFPAEIRLSPQDFGDGVRVISTVRDISERRQAMQALRDSEQRWQFALEGAREGVWDWNLVTNEVFFSRQWKAMLGYEEHEIGNGLEEWEKRVFPDDKQETISEVQKHLSGETPYYQSEHRVRCKDGSYKWILDRGKIVARDEENKPTRMIGTHTDITTMKQAEETIRDLSLRDDLTGLRNRRGLYELGELQLDLAQRLGRKVVLYFIDLDGMKTINDQFGHEQGDRALRDVAQILRDTFRGTDLMARIGGDEFVVLALEMPGADPVSMEHRLEQQLNEFNRYSQRPYTLVASVGLSTQNPDKKESLADLLYRADREMYQTKKQHRAAR